MFDGMVKINKRHGHHCNFNKEAAKIRLDCIHYGFLMRLVSLALLILWILPCVSFAQVDLVKVDKSKRRLYLLQGDQVIREYRIALGKSPKGINSKRAISAHPKGTTT